MYALPFTGPIAGQAIDAVGNGASQVGGTTGLFQAVAASVTGVAIGTTSAPALYNPPASTKLLRIMSVRLGDVSGTIIRAHLRYYWAKEPVLSGLTAGVIQSRSRGVASVASWYTALTVGAAAATFIDSGLGSGGAVAAAFYNLRDDCAGIITVNPGELWYPYVSNAALAMVADVTVIWLETPINQGN